MRTGYEAQLMSKTKTLPIKEIYKCPVCEQVVIRHRVPGSKPYVKWCCGNKMIRIANKCSICGKHIKGANHFQGIHHLKAVAKIKVVTNGE